MGPSLELLHDTHILILMDDPVLRASMVDLFQSMGAKVHCAETQVIAIGMYWRLFREGIRPRAVVTSWRLVNPASVNYEFLKMIGREEVDGTVLDLFDNVTDLDPSAFLAVYTSDPAEAEAVLSKHGIGASVFDQEKIGPEKFVARIAVHEGISCQRVCVSEETVERRLEEVSRRADTERITKPTKRFRTPIPEAG